MMLMSYSHSSGGGGKRGELLLMLRLFLLLLLQLPTPPANVCCFSFSSCCSCLSCFPSASQSLASNGSFDVPAYPGQKISGNTEEIFVTVCLCVCGIVCLPKLSWFIPLIITMSSPSSRVRVCVSVCSSVLSRLNTAIFTLLSILPL